MNRSKKLGWFSKLWSSLVLFFLVACQSKVQSSSASMLKPGDHIGGMTLTTGATEAPPLWAFCSHQDNDHVSKCHIPSKVSKVGIGHVFVLADEIPANLDWAEVTWNLSVDNQPIDLPLFGTYDFVLPGMASKPSPIREVFWKFTAWDIVLTDLKPGQYILRGAAESEYDTYSWIIDLFIEEP